MDSIDDTMLAKDLKGFIHLVPGLFNTGDYFRSIDGVKLYEEFGLLPIYHVFRGRDRRFTEAVDLSIGRISLMDDMAGFVDSVDRLRRLRPGVKHILLGHSRGAMVGVLSEMHRPGIFDKMILDSPALPAGLMPTSISIMRLISFFPHWLKWGWDRTPIDRTYLGARISVMNGIPAATARAHYRRMVWESGAVIAALGKHPLLVDDRIFAGKPTLLIGHVADRIIPYRLVWEWQRRINRPNVIYAQTNGPHYALLHPTEGPAAIAHYRRFLSMI